MYYNLVLLTFMLFSVLGARPRESSYPYLSGDTWWFFCDWRCTDQEGFDPELVKDGDTIYVEQESLPCFVEHYVPKIQHRFIMISPNSERGSDDPLPDRYADLLNLDKVVAWFVQNIDRAPTEKLIPIPIGLNNIYRNPGNSPALDLYIPVSRTQKRKTCFAYANFDVNTNLKARESCIKRLKQLSWISWGHRKGFSEYIKDCSRSVFVISPPGNGIDCHRTWEALLVGCYPVVLSNTLNPLYEELPVVILNNWEELTEELLLEKQKEFDSKVWPQSSREKLYAPYWFNKVREVQEQVRTSVTEH